MGIGILLIALMIINILILFLGVFLVFTPYYYYSIAIFAINIILYLTISISFFKYSNKQLEKEKYVLRSFKLRKCICKEGNINVIEFILKDNKWVNKKDVNFFFSLDNYLFKKPFIIARIVRELRYSIISNQLALSKLLNLKLRINKIDNLIVRFVDGKHTKEYVVVKNYISKNTILSRNVSKSRYYDCYFSNRTYCKYMKRIEKINENIYLIKSF